MSLMQLLCFLSFRCFIRLISSLMCDETSAAKKVGGTIVACNIRIPPLGSTAFILISLTWVSILITRCHTSGQTCSQVNSYGCHVSNQMLCFDKSHEDSLIRQTHVVCINLRNSLQSHPEHISKQMTDSH